MKTAEALQLNTVETKPKALTLMTALLPAALLYAALAFAGGRLFGFSFDAAAFFCGLALLAVCTVLPEKTGTGLAVVSALCAGLALVALPAVRAGAMELANRLFAFSEASNAYAYEYFEQASGETAAVRLALLCAAVLCGAVCALAGRSRAVPVVLFFLLVLFEAYFGVTPGIWHNLFVFACLAHLVAGPKAELRTGAVPVFAFAVIAAVVLVIAPRPAAVVEDYSEHLRDELGRAMMQITKWEPPQAAGVNETHEESRLSEEEANIDASAAQDQREFEHQTQAEQEISRPHRIDWLKIILLLLAVVAILVVPFAPFVLVSRARKLAKEKRAAFADEDNAAAIRAMFRHTVDWLQACGMKTENRPFARCTEDAAAMLSDEYGERYAEAARIWEEAAYSDHAMDEGKREFVRELMEETEKALYERSDRKTRLRLKYGACLCEG
jgi:hypothetical protein